MSSQPHRAIAGRRRWIGVVVASLLATHAVLLGWVAARSSPTLDEPAHLAAGLYIWKYGRFDLYRVNPPLVKAVATLPVVFADPATNWRRVLPVRSRDEPQFRRLKHSCALARHSDWTLEPLEDSLS
jgi:hypothetical protein